MMDVYDERNLVAVSFVVSKYLVSRSMFAFAIAIPVGRAIAFIVIAALRRVDGRIAGGLLRFVRTHRTTAGAATNNDINHLAFNNTSIANQAFKRTALGVIA